MSMILHQGYSHGLPAWHAVTGAGLPVLTPKFWVPPRGEAAVAETTRDDFVMGKLAVLTPRFHVDRESCSPGVSRQNLSRPVGLLSPERIAIVSKHD
jgi:hypothetical protein